MISFKSKAMIKSILPHREPMLMLDSASAVMPGESAAAEKAFFPDERFFEGHFPSSPIVPGVLLIEAMAQCADLAVLSRPENAGKIPLLTACKGVRFLRAVLPGDTVEISAVKTSEVENCFDFSCTVSLDGKKCASANLTITLK